MKKVITSLLLIIILLTLTGCFKRDKMEDINIVTTAYPIEYVINRLYGEESTIKSIYPRSTNPDTYKLTNKQIKDYSEYGLFIYDGNSSERKYATEMLNQNKDLRIIDATYGIEDEKSIWFNPSNILMIGQNIKTELNEYISNQYLLDKIKQRYEDLEIDMTALEAEIKKTADNSENKTIIVADESLNFLKKYGFDVINLSSNNKIKENNLEKAKVLLNQNKVSYVFVIENDNIEEEIESLKTGYNVEFIYIKRVNTITDEDVNNNDDYLSIMHNNLDMIKKETYK